MRVADRQTMQTGAGMLPTLEWRSGISMNSRPLPSPVGGGGGGPGWRGGDAQRLGMKDCSSVQRNGMMQIGATCTTRHAHPTVTTESLQSHTRVWRPCSHAVQVAATTRGLDGADWCSPQAAWREKRQAHLGGRGLGPDEARVPDPERPGDLGSQELCAARSRKPEVTRAIWCSGSALCHNPRWFGPSYRRIVHVVGSDRTPDRVPVDRGVADRNACSECGPVSWLLLEHCC